MTEINSPNNVIRIEGFNIQTNNNAPFQVFHISQYQLNSFNELFFLNSFFKSNETYNKQNCNPLFNGRPLFGRPSCTFICKLLKLVELILKLIVIQCALKIS